MTVNHETIVADHRPNVVGAFDDDVDVVVVAAVAFGVVVGAFGVVAGNVVANDLSCVGYQLVC